MNEDLMSEDKDTGPGGGHAASGQTEEEPVITGTLFLTTVFLIMIFGFWVMMYFTLLGR